MEAADHYRQFVYLAPVLLCCFGIAPVNAVSHAFISSKHFFYHWSVSMFKFKNHHEPTAAKFAVGISQPPHAVPLDKVLMGFTLLQYQKSKAGSSATSIVVQENVTLEGGCQDEFDVIARTVMFIQPYHSLQRLIYPTHRTDIIIKTDAADSDPYDYCLF